MEIDAGDLRRHREGEDRPGGDAKREAPMVMSRSLPPGGTGRNGARLSPKGAWAPLAPPERGDVSRGRSSGHRGSR